MTHTFANNSLCPKCFKKCKDLVRYEGCDICGFKTPQGTGLMSMVIPEMYYHVVFRENPGFKWAEWEEE